MSETPQELRSKQAFLSWEDSVPSVHSALVQLQSSATRTEGLYENFKAGASAELQLAWGQVAVVVSMTQWAESKPVLESTLDKVAKMLLKDSDQPELGVMTRNELLDSLKTAE